MKLVSVSYAQSRLNFFRDQLAAANRRLDWSMKHNPDWYDHSEKGEVVSYYEWAVKMAEKEVDMRQAFFERNKKVAEIFPRSLLCRVYALCATTDERASCPVG